MKIFDDPAEFRQSKTYRSVQFVAKTRPLQSCDSQYYHKKLYILRFVCKNKKNFKNILTWVRFLNFLAMEIEQEIENIMNDIVRP